MSPLLSADELEQLTRIVNRKSLACPFFIRGTLLPVITYFRGKITWREVKERADLGMDVWRRMSSGDAADLQESYHQETEAVAAIHYAFRGLDPSVPAGEALLRERLLRILREYAALPETERKVFFL